MPEIITMKKSEYEKITAAKLRKKYMETPPEGYTSKEIQRMSVADILDMDYFLHEMDFINCPVDFHTEPDTIIRLINDYPEEPDDPDIPY